MSWTLRYNGMEKSLADWGLNNPVRTLVSQGRDLLTFCADGALADSAPVFPFHADVTLYRDRSQNADGTYWGGIGWFSGKVIAVPSRGTPGAESLSYKIAGPWWYLENYTFLQAYRNVFLGYSTGIVQPQYGQKYSSHLFLNQGFATTGAVNPWVKITTGQQILEVLNWVLMPFTNQNVAAPFQIGMVTPDADAPIDEVRDLTCAEVIHKLLRWTPDAVTWFDYSTSPPTFHCRRRSELTGALVGMVNDVLESFSILPRQDLQAPSVRIFYETVISVNGQATLSLAEDHYPDPLPVDPQSQFATLQFTIDLQGLQSTVATGVLGVDGLNPTDPSWWISKHPQLDSTDSRAGIQSFSIDPNSLERIPNPPTDSHGNAVADKGYTLELTSGQIADWMNKDAQRMTIKIRANITFKNGTALKNQLLSYQCLTTNASAGVYQSQNISAYPEPLPVGLAKVIYDAISPLQYQGSAVLVEDECSGRVTVGKTLDLAGSSTAAWATMNSLVQRVTEELATGRTTVDFGPPGYLTAGQLVDLLRVSRARNIRSNYSMRPQGSSNASSGSISLGRQMPEKNSIPGVIPPNPQVVSENADGTGGNITCLAAGGDASIVLSGARGFGSINLQLSAAGGHSMNIRPLSVCQDGVPGTIYVLASAFIAS